MRLRAILLAAALASPASAVAPSTAREFVELPPGRYTVTLTGLATTVCARAVAAEWAKLPEIESATVDFEKNTAIIAVRLDKIAKVAILRKTLRKAEKLSNLGATYDIRTIAYRLTK